MPIKTAELHRARINTAGAYVCLDEFHLFAIGIRPYHGRIPIVRLGGHREEDETGWQCADREVYEECGLHIRQLVPPATYLCHWDHLESELEKIEWQPKTGQELAPLLVIRYCHEEQIHLSLMYLAQAEGVPVPSSEVKGLLLLRAEEVHSLCREPQTLEQYLQKGGRALLKDGFDTKMVLEPFAQLRLLSRILSIQSEIQSAQSYAL